MSQDSIKKAAELLGGQAALARALLLTPACVSQWIRAARPIPASRCPDIERATNGAVRCEDLRPDVDWAYLRGTAQHHEVA